MPCKFCETIYNDSTIANKDYIYKDDRTGIFSIAIDTGDSFYPVALNNIHYCPFCSRELKSMDI